MKQLALIISLTCISMPSFAVVWENDPSITPQEREQRKEHNKRMRMKNEERELQMHQKTAEAYEKYAQKINQIKQMHSSKRWQARSNAKDAARNNAIYQATQAYIQEIDKIKEEYAPLMG